LDVRRSKYNFGLKNSKKMKQPELGKKLTEFRNEIGLTQEELSEKTKINIRTIQRIELGEVTPRAYTLKIILKNLGRDFAEINGENEYPDIEKPTILKAAWTAGLILAINNILFIALVFLRDVYGIRNAVHLIALALIISIILTFFLNRGIIYVGKLFNNPYLRVTGYIGIFLALICNLAYVSQFYISDFNVSIIAKGFLILSAMNGIFYGVGLLLLKQYYKDLALFAGIMLISGSVLLIVPVGFVELIGVIISIPALITQVLLFYRIQKQQSDTVVLS